MPYQTLTNGNYDECPLCDSLITIGEVRLNANTGKITGFVTRDTLRSEATLEPTVVSRWLSVDPVVHPYESPYAAFENNPIYFIDPDGRKVKPMDKESMELVKKTVTPAESEYVQYDADGNIDVDMLRIGEAELESVSDNFCSLMEVCAAEELVELRVSESFPSFSKNPGESLERDFSRINSFEVFPKPVNFVQDKWLESGGNKDRSGDNDKGESFDEFLNRSLQIGVLSEGDDKPTLNGITGITVYPLGWGTKEGLIYFSTSGNSQIYINIHAYTSPELRMFGAKYMAHELYGHFLFKTSGLPSSHTDKYLPLEKHISKSEQNAVKNYKSHEAGN